MKNPKLRALEDVPITPRSDEDKSPRSYLRRIRSHVWRNHPERARVIQIQLRKEIWDNPTELQRWFCVECPNGN